MMPLKDTRQVGDILLALADELGLGTPPAAAAATEESGEEEPPSAPVDLDPPAEAAVLPWNRVSDPSALG